MADTVEGAFELLGNMVRQHLFYKEEDVSSNISTLSPSCLKNFCPVADYGSQYERMLCLLHEKQFKKLAEKHSSLKDMLVLQVAGLLKNVDKIIQ